MAKPFSDEETGKEYYMIITNQGSVYGGSYIILDSKECTLTGGLSYSQFPYNIDILRFNYHYRITL